MVFLLVRCEKFGMSFVYIIDGSLVTISKIEKKCFSEDVIVLTNCVAPDEIPH